jgi:integrase
MRRDELAGLTVGSLAERRGVKHFTVLGKGSKTRYVPAHPAALEAINQYLAAAGHAASRSDPLFKPIKNNRTGKLNAALTGGGIYAEIKKYAEQVGIEVDGMGCHALRATAATNALEHQADIAYVQA